MNGYTGVITYKILPYIYPVKPEKITSWSKKFKLALVKW